MIIPIVMVVVMTMIIMVVMVMMLVGMMTFSHAVRCRRPLILLRPTNGRSSMTTTMRLEERSGRGIRQCRPVHRRTNVCSRGRSGRVLG